MHPAALWVALGEWDHRFGFPRPLPVRGEDSDGISVRVVRRGAAETTGGPDP